MGGKLKEFGKVEIPILIGTKLISKHFSPAFNDFYSKYLLKLGDFCNFIKTQTDILHSDVRRYVYHFTIFSKSNYGVGVSGDNLCFNKTLCM